jgi:hypothetical protein
VIRWKYLISFTPSRQACPLEEQAVTQLFLTLFPDVNSSSTLVGTFEKERLLHNDVSLALKKKKKKKKKSRKLMKNTVDVNQMSIWQSAC